MMAILYSYAAIFAALSVFNVASLAQAGEIQDVSVRTAAHRTFSKRTTLPAQFFPAYNSQRVQISYGPFVAPSSSEDNGMRSFERLNIEMPCTDCLITWMQAGLVYPNGTYANADTGMWLHHVVLTNMDRLSVTCGTDFGGDRFFASGNERTPANICANGTDQVGYYISPNTTVAILVELMNETPDARPAVVTITYEFIPKQPSPFPFSPVVPIWLDINSNCSSNSEEPAKNNTAFDYNMQPRWKADFAGRATFIIGHLHDGGTHIQVLKNGNAVCDCAAAYGETPGYVESGSMSMGNMSMPGMDMVHISSISTCMNPTDTKVGDEWGVHAFYNTSLHAPMVEADGSLSPIMGIALVYMAQSGIGNGTLGSISSQMQSSTTSMATGMSSMTSGMSMTGTSASTTAASAGASKSSSSAHTSSTNAAADRWVSGGVIFGALAAAILI